MPFVSDSQRKFCWVKYNRDIREGKKPKWDCAEWERSNKSSKRHSKRSSKNIKSSKQRSKSINKNTIVYRSPRLSDMSKNSRRYMRSKVSKSLGRKIHTGARGGKYILVNGRKVYV